MPKRWIEFLYRHPVLNFVLMAAYFLLFGLSSVNLFVVLKMNIDLFVNYGLQVIEDGALQQLIELIGNAFLSIALLVLYKIGEKILVDKLTEKKYGADGAVATDPVATAAAPVAAGNALNDPPNSP